MTQTGTVVTEDATRGLEQLRETRLATLLLVVRNPRAAFGLMIVFGLVMVAIFAPLLTSHSPYRMEMLRPFAPFSLEHPLGTDEFGRDNLSRLIYGARISLFVGITATLFQVLMGTALGVMAGFLRRLVDDLIMRILDIFYAFPRYLLAMLLIAVMGPSLPAIIFVIGFVGIPRFARIVRGSVLSAKERDYVLAAKALGVGKWAIMRRHLLPNVLAPVIVLASLNLAQAIMTEASLSFLGLGVQEPIPTWGAMLSKGRAFMRTYPHLTIMPGLAIMLVVLGFNLVGDVLRDVMDPRFKGRRLG